MSEFPAVLADSDSLIKRAIELGTALKLLGARSGTLIARSARLCRTARTIRGAAATSTRR